jgi:hypothetical protein
VAYSKGKFLYWAGIAFAIEIHENKEYIFVEERPIEIQHFFSKDNKMHYIQVGDAQLSEISPDKVLEAKKSAKAAKDIFDAEKLFKELEGTYKSELFPYQGAFRQIGASFFFYPEPNHPGLPCQLLHVARDKEDHIQAIEMTFFDPVPNKKMRFFQNQKNEWEIEILEFLTGTLCEKWKKTG